MLTCFNRKQKTLACLNSLFQSDIPDNFLLNIFLVDDGCTDGTGIAVNSTFPSVKIIKGTGNLFWAGGMRLAWKTALESKEFGAFLLLNDDVVLEKNFWELFKNTEAFCFNKFGCEGIYSAATKDSISNKISYGGNIIVKQGFRVSSKKVLPNDQPQEIDFANANILWVDNTVVKKAGIFDEHFTHGIADYDYSLSAKKAGIPVLLTNGIGGSCTDDHGNNWKSSKIPLKKRIQYLKSPTGLAYTQYLYYIRKHFTLAYPYTLVMLWLKTLFPQFWDKLKNHAA